jgi:ADP-heptose:LPS heptosyltransferase
MAHAGIVGNHEVGAEPLADFSAILETERPGRIDRRQPRRADLMIADDSGVGHVRAVLNKGRVIYSDGSVATHRTANVTDMSFG